MKTILVLNDQTAEAEHAAKFALDVAKHLDAQVLLTNLAGEERTEAITALVQASGTRHKEITQWRRHTGMRGGLIRQFFVRHGLKPNITEIDAREFSVEELAGKIIKDNVWMIVKGMTDIASPGMATTAINVQSLFNRVLCPLLLVPASAKIKDFERIIYTTDMRYCKLQIVRFLAELAAPYRADLVVAHLSAKGLPHIEDNYAVQLFTTQIVQKVSHSRLFFNNTKDRDLGKAVDVLIHTMHADLLVMVHHCYHFTKIIGPYIEPSLSIQLTLPVLVVPY